MTEFGEYRPTGRELRDPVARLVELQTESGLHHTAIVFDEAYREHEALNLNVTLVESFLEYPMVIGLVELSKRFPEQGAFIYPTGRVWTLGDALRTYRDRYKPIGIRAALEVCVLAAQILGEAGETGHMQGCFSHGNLSPWRIALKTDGQLQIFGYGLGHVDWLMHASDAKRPISAESLRYAPPERLEGQPEDTSADVHSLAVIAHEIMTGKPLYDTHDIAKLKHMITMSEGTSMLTGGETDLPPKLAKTLARALIYDPDTRVEAEEFADEMRGLLDAPFATGPTLAEVMKEVTDASRDVRPKAKRLKEVKSATGIFTPGQLAEMADDDEDEEDEPVPSSEGRWAKVSRAGRAEATPAPAPARGKSGTPGASANPEPGKDAAEEGDAAAAEPARRRRRTIATPVEAAKEAPARRRRRRAEAEPSDAAPSAVAAPAAEEAAPPRRRTRRTAPEAEPEAPKPAPPPRRTRRTTAAAETAEAAAEPAPEPAAPKRRTRRGAATSAASDANQASPAAEPTAEESAAPRRRRRTTTPAPEADAAPAAEPRRRRRTAASTSSETDSPAEPATPRRRRRGATAEPATPPAAAEAEAKPEPERRRRRRSTDDSEAAPAPSAEPEAAPRRRRRTTTTAAPDADADEPAATPRRRRRRTED
ncbi:MAG: hypothetical protein ACI8PZ_004200 [Myxococcota bacterium]|jgi:hypothetical protein